MARRIQGMRRRQGFTIPELLVSMALILFIMVILSQTFVTGADMFRKLKAMGDMQERLRSVSTRLRAELDTDHFEDTLLLGGGKSKSRSRLSDVDLRVEPPPLAGFFRIWQVSTATEGTDLYGVPSYQGSNHFLHFTVRLKGNRPESYASATLYGASPLTSPSQPLFTAYPADYYQPNNTYKNQWYEVVYFLQPTGQSANGTPLFALYRRQLVAVTGQATSMMNTPPGQQPNTNPPSPYYNDTPPPAYAEVSCKPDYSTGYSTLYFNSQADLTVPQRRFGTDPDPASAGRLAVINGMYTYPRLLDQPGTASFQWADDLLLSDVVSFDIKTLYDTPAGIGTDFVDLPLTTDPVAGGNNTVFGPLGIGVFDSWSQAQLPPPGSSGNPYDYFNNWYNPGNDKSLPLKIHVRALQITIRMWDVKTEQTAQLTIVQEM